MARPHFGNELDNYNGSIYPGVDSQGQFLTWLPVDRMPFTKTFDTSGNVLTHTVILNTIPNQSFALSGAQFKQTNTYDQYNNRITATDFVKV